MAEIRTKISSLPSANTIANSDVIPITVSGTTKKVTVDTLITQSANSISSAISSLPRVFGTYSYGYSNINNITTSNTYILLSSDDGKLITLSNANSCVVTVPPNLSNTFSCSVMQTGNGSILFSNTANSYIFNSANSFTVSAKYGIASVISFGVANNYVISGDVM